VAAVPAEPVAEPVEAAEPAAAVPAEPVVEPEPLAEAAEEPTSDAPTPEEGDRTDVDA
jgi:hypothetical protein